MRAEIFRTKSVAEGLVLNEIRSNMRLVEYQPGNGTRYKLVVTKLPPSFSERIGYGGTAYVVNLLTDPGDQRCVVIADYEYIHHTKMEALSKSIVDRVVLAELLGHLLGQDSTTLQDMNEGHMHAE